MRCPAHTTTSFDFSRRAAIAFPSRPGTSPGTGKTSQVPREELLHVHKVSDCARFFSYKPVRHGTMLPSLRRNEIGTSELDPFRSSIGAVGELVGIDGGVVSGVINLESSGVEASDWRPRHDERYHEA